MREHARTQTAILLRRMAFQIGRTARSVKDAETIHDLRVAIRRLTCCLRVFAKFYPGDSWKEIRKDLEGLRRVAERVRDRDITLALLAESGAARRGAAVVRLDADRKQTARELLLEARRWKKRGFSRKWRIRLDL